MEDENEVESVPESDPEPEYESDPEPEDDGTPEYGGSVDGQYDEFVQHIQKLGFSYVNCGSFRNTFMRGKVVIKVPRNVDGVNDNRTEGFAWRKYKSNRTSKGYFLAPCRLLPNGCLMMVTVDTHSIAWDDPQRPKWTSHIEGGQVGTYRGQVVAYDYALNIPERHKWEEEWGAESEWFNQNYFHEDEENVA